MVIMCMPIGVHQACACWGALGVHPVHCIAPMHWSSMRPCAHAKSMGSSSLLEPISLGVFFFLVLLFLRIYFGLFWKKFWVNFIWIDHLVYMYLFSKFKIIYLFQIESFRQGSGQGRVISILIRLFTFEFYLNPIKF